MHESFISLVVRYGPLEGMLYSISNSPGIVYQRMLHYTAIKLQRYQHSLKSIEECESDDKGCILTDIFIPLLPP